MISLFSCYNKQMQFTFTAENMYFMSDFSLVSMISTTAIFDRLLKSTTTDVRKVTTANEFASVAVATATLRLGKVVQMWTSEWFGCSPTHCTLAVYNQALYAGRGGTAIYTREEYTEEEKRQVASNGWSVDCSSTSIRKNQLTSND